MIQLSKAKRKQPYQIKALKGSQETNLFFQNIGCHLGDEIRLIRQIAGNYIVEIKDGRFAIDKRFAEKIWVKPS
jgi:ferrous iron transport protein A